MKIKSLLSILAFASIIATLTACQSGGISSSDILSSEDESSSTVSSDISFFESSLNASSSSALSDSSSENVSDSSLETSAPPTVPSENGERILIAYFSRFGNTDYPDDVDASTSASVVIDNRRFGTTEYVARMIQETVGGDIHLIETATPYTTDFDELRDVNHNEMASNYLPELKESALDISKYDTVFVGYPVWATDVPQAVISFLNKYDLSDKKVIPFCTHDGYGAGSSYGTIASASRAKNTADGLAIEAKDVPHSKKNGVGLA